MDYLQIFTIVFGLIKSLLIESIEYPIETGELAVEEKEELLPYSLQIKYATVPWQHIV